MAVKRFYETFHPEHYDLRIDVNRKNKEINGTSTITGDVVENPVFINQKFMTIDSVKVEGKVVAHGKAKKILVYKYKAKKNYRRTQGHRQPYTKVEITSIKVAAEKKAETK